MVAPEDLSRRPQPRALVALSDPARAGFVARGLRAGGLVPVLAFDENDIRTCLTQNTFVVLLIESELAAEVLPEVTDPTSPPVTPPILVVGDPLVEVVSDDWIRSEASVEEIAARVTALVRISRPVALPAPLRWGPLELDVQRRISRWNGSAVALTSIQFRILEILVFAAGTVVTPAELSRRLWGTQSFEDAERLGAHIRRIRKTLRKVAAPDDFLVTVRAEGFRLADYDLDESIDLAPLEFSH